jgi:carboxymethylenebutenolidase
MMASAMQEATVWNVFETTALGGMTAGTTMMSVDGKDIHTYIARPDGEGPYPGVVLLHHAPGWDEYYREFARRFAQHGFIAVCPNLYDEWGAGTPDEVAAKARADGGVADDTVVADAQASLDWIKAQPSSNGKVGVIGSCSAGRHAMLAAAKADGFSAVVDLWGASVVVTPDKLTPKQPVAVIDMVSNINMPILGLFGNDDQNPSPEAVNTLEAALKAAGKDPMFTRYDGAGHGFFYYHTPAYRQQQAMDGWEKVEAFFKQHLL